MDIFTKGALWDYWKMGSDEIEPTDNESFDLEEIDHDDEQEISVIFRIETNLFNYEKPMCKEFKEFNYLLKIDPDLFTKDIKGFKTYEEFKDGWIYEWNKDVPWVDEKPCTDTGVWKEPKPVKHYYHEAYEREELCEIHEPPVCKLRTFKMTKYSFGDDEEYVAVKEDEYDGPWKQRNIDEYWWRIYKFGDLEVLESRNFKAAVQHEFLLNKPTWRIYQANIRGVSHSNSF
ncbi:hypothetical protein Tco_1484612 [Tanacetum coccineum]